MKNTLSIGKTDQLQFLRFLAFCLIFCHHASVTVLGFPTGNGSGIAVSFFFLLSGFVSTLSLHKKDAPMRWYSPFTYLWGKYTKVMPLHLLTLGLAVLCSNLPAAVALMDSEWLSLQLSSFFRNGLLIHSWFNNVHRYDYNGVSWFLSTIMLSYLLTVPVNALLKKISQTKFSKPILLLLVVALTALNALYCYSTRDLEHEYFHYIFPPARLFEYFAGMGMYYLLLSEEKTAPQKIGTTLVFTALEVLTLGLWIGYMYIPTALPWTQFTCRWMLPNLLLLAVFAVGRGYLSGAFRLPALKRLGDISFECFLIHQLVIRFYQGFNTFYTSTPTEDILSQIYCLVLTVCIALFINKRTSKKNLNK